MVLVPILAIVFGVAGLAVVAVRLLKQRKHKEPPTWTRSAYFLGIAAAGMGFWTSHLIK
jgi:NO-binding membrane sensor protein with MHYT domain